MLFANGCRYQSAGWDMGGGGAYRHPTCSALPTGMGLGDVRRDRRYSSRRRSRHEIEDSDHTLDAVVSRRFLVYMLIALCVLIVLGFFSTVVGGVYLSRAVQPSIHGIVDNINQLLCIMAIICGLIMLLSSAVLLRVLVCKRPAWGSGGHDPNTGAAGGTIDDFSLRQSPLRGVTSTLYSSDSLGDTDMDHRGMCPPLSVSLDVSQLQSPPAYWDVTSSTAAGAGGNTQPPKYSTDPPPRYSQLDLSSLSTGPGASSSNNCRRYSPPENTTRLSPMQLHKL